MTTIQVLKRRLDFLGFTLETCRRAFEIAQAQEIVDLRKRIEDFSERREDAGISALIEHYSKRIDLLSKSDAENWLFAFREAFLAAPDADPELLSELASSLFPGGVRRAEFLRAGRDAVLVSGWPRSRTNEPFFSPCLTAVWGNSPTAMRAGNSRIAWQPARFAPWGTERATPRRNTPTSEMVHMEKEIIGYMRAGNERNYSHPMMISPPLQRVNWRRSLVRAAGFPAKWIGFVNTLYCPPLNARGH